MQRFEAKTKSIDFFYEMQKTFHKLKTFLQFLNIKKNNFKYIFEF